MLSTTILEAVVAWLYSLYHTLTARLELKDLAAHNWLHLVTCSSLMKKGGTEGPPVVQRLFYFRSEDEYPNQEPQIG